MAQFLINHVYRLAGTAVGGRNPVRIMGVLNASPESFYKGSVVKPGEQTRNAVKRMVSEGADFIDVGGMSTAPYLSAAVSEEIEMQRVQNAVRDVRSVSEIPVSVDTCRASVAEAALAGGADIINDVTGLKHDEEMRSVVSRFRPSVVLCAYGTGTVTGNLVDATANLLEQSIGIARDCGVPTDNISVDPAIGFFRRTGQGQLFTRISSDWTDRDIQVLGRLQAIGHGYPITLSVSNKSFLGKILERDEAEEREFGSAAAEAVCVLYGADIVRTHNVGQTRDAITVASKLSGRPLPGMDCTSMDMP